jgi:hypothetical protein
MPTELPDEVEPGVSAGPSARPAAPPTVHNAPVAPAEPRLGEPQSPAAQPPPEDRLPEAPPQAAPDREIDAEPSPKAAADVATQPDADFAEPPAGPLTGQVTYIFAYDVAYDMSRQPIEHLLGCRPAEPQVPADRRIPAGAFFYRPRTFVLPSRRRQGPGGAEVEIARSVAVYPVGSISILFHVPFRVAGIDELAALRDLRVEGTDLAAEARSLAEQAKQELLALLIAPVEVLGEEEAYTVFCLDSASLRAVDPGFVASDWVHDNRRRVAALLLDDNPELLSDQEVTDTVRHALTYYRHDLALMDWDAALVIDERRNFEQVLIAMELANVQLAELQAYDHILDDVLEQSYRNVLIRGGRRLQLGPTLSRLRELALDLSRLSDELSNAAKFFGDWHLARVYQRLSVLFHLNDWRSAVDRKLDALDKLYHTLRQDQINRWMMILEATIVLLFVLDLVLILLDVLK